MNSLRPERDDAEHRIVDVIGDIFGSDVDAHQPAVPDVRHGNARRS